MVDVGRGEDRDGGVEAGEETGDAVVEYWLGEGVDLLMVLTGLALEGRAG